MFHRTSRGMMDIYYDMPELEGVFKAIGDEITKRPEVADSIERDSRTAWNALVPYVEGKPIKDAEQLKVFYSAWVAWWICMEHYFVIPDQLQVPEAIRARMLRLRAETQEYSDVGDDIYFRYIRENHPKCVAIAPVLLPNEVYRLDTLSESELGEIRSRLNGSMILTAKGESQIVPVKDLDSALATYRIQIAREDIAATDQIVGQVASRGSAHGKVRLVLYKEDIGTLEAGEILVTQMTAPDFVPAMKKAAAIITDEGGITSHAAIVSRELGKPCVIGTKFATQLLKDGDTVEVDANVGVVRIVKRA